MSAEILRTLILTDWVLRNVHIQHCTWGDTSVHLL